MSPGKLRNLRLQMVHSRVLFSRNFHPNKNLELKQKMKCMHLCRNDPPLLISGLYDSLFYVTFAHHF